MSVSRFSGFAVATTLLVLATAPDARGVVSVDIVWTATTGAGIPGGSVIDALPGDVLTAEVRLNADAGGVSSYALSLEFDRDLRNELDIVSVTAPSGGSFLFSFTVDDVESVQESTSTDIGELLTFEQAGFANFGPVSTTVTILTVEFLATGNVRPDGDDVFSGTFNVGVDAIGDRGDNIDITDITSSVVFGSAAVNGPPIPTPALRPWGLVAASLGLLAVLALTLHRRSA